MPQVPVYNMEGQVVGEINLRDDIFGIEPHVAVMHQALVRQLANARLGTHSTKTRGEVSGGGRKPWPQKHTGRARQGSIRAPQWVGGGIVFGPKPRSYYQKMPKKMRRLAYKSALSVKARQDQIVILDELHFDTPRTKAMRELLAKLPVNGSVLILLPSKDENIQKSANNLPNVKTILANYLNIKDLLGYDYLVMPRKSVEIIESILGN
ncbi:MAG: 50S ribosomal protein L4 [Anaerolineae bacterium]|nr:50S ribosomal protein L4 [Anaerolineae bacterium]MDW8101533.1 50S ribosomal protein L4 [Anaerolineae bacterium]